MAKQYTNLFPEIVDFGNLWLAWRKASRGKRGRQATAGFEMTLEDQLIRLQRELKDQTYRPGGYYSFHIRDPKNGWFRPPHSEIGLFTTRFVMSLSRFSKGPLSAIPTPIGWGREPTLRSAGHRSSRNATATFYNVTSGSFFRVLIIGSWKI